MNIVIDPQFTVDLLRQLVQIDSVNPSLVPGGKGEEEIAHFIARLLEHAGVEVALQDVAPGRPNVIGRLRGSGGGKTLILNAHTDVVTVEGMKDPFSAHVQDGKLYGRGACDTKSGLVAGLSALLALHKAGVSLAGDLILVGACDEEYASIGTQALLKEIQGDGCIILESSGLAVAVAHGGFVWAEVETHGIAAHGSLPDQGVDAIVKMGRVLTELDALGQHIHREKAFYSALAQETMRPSVHASLIQGGRELSSYPDRCLLQIERRLIPTETLKDVQAELDGMLSRVAAEDPQFKAQWRTTFFREPWQAAEGPLLAALNHACETELGARPERFTAMAWTDSALMEKAGIPTLVFGPDGDGSHGTLEYAEIDSVIACARVLARMTMEFCS